MTSSYDENIISDLHKDAYGFRPDSSFWITFEAFNPEQKQALWDSILSDLERSIDDEEYAQEAAIIEFEDRIDNLMHDCNNRKSIVDWFLRASQNSNDIEGFELFNGLPFGYLKSKGYV